MAVDEATMDAVFEVMKAHDVAEARDDELVQEAYALVEELTEQVELVAGAYEDEDARRAALLEEVENILLDDGLVEGPAVFRTE
jgi:stalled ribosome rescue protein Dom34